MHICRQHFKMPPSPPFFFLIKVASIESGRERWRGRKTQTSQIKLTSSLLHKLVGSGVCFEIGINANGSTQTVYFDRWDGIYTWEHVADEAEDFPGLFSSWTGSLEDPDYQQKKQCWNRIFPCCPLPSEQAEDVLLYEGTSSASDSPPQTIFWTFQQNY